jgi:hypothetical protein
VILLDTINNKTDTKIQNVIKSYNIQIQSVKYISGIAIAFVVLFVSAIFACDLGKLYNFMKLSKPSNIKDTSNLKKSVKSNSESIVLCTEDSLTLKSFSNSQIEIKENFQENPKAVSKKLKWKPKKNECIKAYVARLEKLTSKALPTLGEQHREKFLREKFLENLPDDLVRKIKINANNITWKETVKTAFLIIETVNVETK